MGGDSRYIYGMQLMKMSAEAIQEKGPLGALTSSVQLSVGHENLGLRCLTSSVVTLDFANSKRWLDRKRPDRESEVFSLSHFLAFSPMAMVATLPLDLPKFLFKHGRSGPSHITLDALLDIRSFMYLVSDVMKRRSASLGYSLLVKSKQWTETQSC